MNIIKISEQVFETIQNNDIKPIDAEHIPYNQLCIAFPYNFLRSASDMIEDNYKELKLQANRQGIGLKKILEDKRQEVQEQEKKIVNYCDADLHIIFNIENFQVTIKHSKPQIIGLKEQILFYGFKAFGMFPIIKVNQMSDNDIWLYNSMVKLVSGVVYALNNPEIEFSEVTAEGLNSKGNSNKPVVHRNNKNIRYITGIKSYNYTIRTESESKRIYNMEAWEVRGHWRHYRNGSKVWVNAYVKGDKEKLTEQNNIYKLNNIKSDSQG
jgi:hypothetical protein